MPGPLVRDRHPAVAWPRREPEADQLAVDVAQLGDRRAGLGVDRPQPRVHDVAVLHDLEARDGVVRGQRAVPAHAAREAERLRVLVEESSRSTVRCGPDRVPVGVRPPDHHAPPADREPLGPADRHALHERHRLAVTLERRHDPRALLGARLVAEPDDARAVARRQALDHPDRVVRDLVSTPGRAVPRVELVAAALGGGEGETVRRIGGPGGERQHRRAEPGLPTGNSRHIRRVARAVQPRINRSPMP